MQDPSVVLSEQLLLERPPRNKCGSRKTNLVSTIVLSFISFAFGIKFSLNIWQCCGGQRLGVQQLAYSMVSVVPQRNTVFRSMTHPWEGHGPAVRQASTSPTSRATHVASAVSEGKLTGDCIGIDLGTTFSCVGIFRNENVDILANEQGNRITPSYVAWTPDNQQLVGDLAKSQASLNPENTIFDAKRLIGCKVSDRTVQEDMKFWPFEVVDKDGSPMVVVNAGERKEVSPEQISAIVLSKMRTIAEEYLGRKVEYAVVTVPAYFNGAQRKATKDAGTMAGLKVLQVINEPTAAAIAYGLDKQLKAKQTILVYDLGGGTLDVTLLSVTNGVFEVMATAGESHLGGQDFDQRLISHFAEVFLRNTEIDITNNKRALSRLRKACEAAKHDLSLQQSVTVEIEALADGVDLRETITRSRFEELCEDLFAKALAPVERVMWDVAEGDVNEIVLVGGSTRMPRVVQMLQDRFKGKSPNQGINPDEAIAYGAAVQGVICMNV